MRRHGISLVELMFVVGLASLILVVSSGYLVSAFREWRFAQVRSDLDRSLMMSFKIMQARMKRSNIMSVWIISPNSISFLSGEDEEGRIDRFVADPTDPAPVRYSMDRLIIWHRHHVVYHDPATRQLRMGMEPLDKPSANPSRFRLDKYTPKPTDILIGTQIDKVEFEMPRLNDEPVNYRPRNPVRVKLWGSTPDGRYKTRFESTIMVENSYFQTGDVQVAPGPLR